MLQYALIIICVIVILLLYLYFNKVGKNIEGLWKSDEYHLFIEDTTNPCKNISIMDNEDNAFKGKMILCPINTMEDKEKYVCYIKCKLVKSARKNFPNCSVIILDQKKNTLIIGKQEFSKI